MCNPHRGRFCTTTWADPSGLGLVLGAEFTPSLRAHPHHRSVHPGTPRPQQIDRRILIALEVMDTVGATAWSTWHISRVGEGLHRHLDHQLQQPTTPGHGHLRGRPWAPEPVDDRVSPHLCGARARPPTRTHQVGSHQVGAPKLITLKALAYWLLEIHRCLKGADPGPN